MALPGSLFEFGRKNEKEKKRQTDASPFQSLPSRPLLHVHEEFVRTESPSHDQGIGSFEILNLIDVTLFSCPFFEKV